MRDLTSQQLELASSDYDLRITNLARFIYSKLPTKKGSLIDIGAGNGLILKFFKEKGFTVYGVELEKDQVHEMRQDFKLQGVSIQQGDIMKMRGKNDFDVVIASDVIEHIQEDNKALTNLFSFVKPNGYLIITVPAHSHLYGLRDKKWGHYRRYDKKALLQSVSQLPQSQLVGIWYWNFLGYFAYYFYERILKKPIREDFRYTQSTISKVIRLFLDFFLKGEEFIRRPMIGLTLCAIIQKKS